MYIEKGDKLAGKKIRVKEVNIQTPKCP